MDTSEFKSILAIGETIGVGFKRCGNGIGNDVYETVCSFLNRFGGKLFLGVLDDGTVVGVPEKAASDYVKKIISCVSNPSLFYPTVYLSPKIIQYEGKNIIYININPSADVHSYKRIIYDRINDADVKVTSTTQIEQMCIRKQNIYTERKIFPYVGMEDMRLDLLPKIRIMANNTSAREHCWSSMSDEELLKSARLYCKDPVTGEAGFNLAAVMLLGKDDVIMDVAPAYLTDALLRRDNIDRYDDRELIKTNLIESYDLLMEFSRKHLPDPFFLEGTQRKSLRRIIVREMIANTLIHREYTSAFHAKFVIEEKRMYVENANRAAQNTILTADDIEPVSKNPIIAGFFRNIGYADRPGSGVKKLFKYCKVYGGADPQFIEGDIYRIIVPLKERFSENESGEISAATQSGTTQSATQSGTTQSGVKAEAENQICAAILQDPCLSQSQIASTTGLNVNTVKYYMRKMQSQGILRREGNSRKGYWSLAVR